MALSKKYLIIGTVFVLLTGSLAHFVYGWSGQNFFTGFFVPINESTWEHMKLIFFPMLLYMLATGTEQPCAMLWGTLAGTWLIPVLFYTYTGVLGKNVFVLDLAIFFLCVLAGFWVAGRLSVMSSKEEHSLCKSPHGIWIAGILTVLMILGFFLFTYFPPYLGLFSDVPSASYIIFPGAFR